MTAIVGAGGAAGDSTWGPPDNAYTSTTSTSAPQLAMSPSGNAVVAWFERNGSNYHNVWAALYSPSLGWLPAELVFAGTTNPGHLFLEEVAIDGDGNPAILVTNISYDDVNMTDVTQWIVLRYLGGSPWDQEVVASDIYGAQSAIVFGEVGEMFVMREVADGSGNVSIVVHHHPTGSSWKPPSTLVSNSSTLWPFFEGMAADASGYCAVTWTMSNLSGYAVEAWGAVYVASVGWDTFRLDAGADAGSAWDVSMSGSIATFLFAEYAGSTGTLHMSPYLSTGFLGNDDMLSGAPSVPFSAHVSSGVPGEAVAVWNDFSVPGRHIWGALWTGAGWGEPVQVESMAGNASEPSIAADASGGATVVWTQPTTGNNTVYAARYSTMGGWGAPVAISTAGGTARSAQFATSGDRGFALWHTTVGATRNITAVGFDRDITPPALSVDPLPPLVNTSTVIISGFTDPGAFVFVNGNPVAVGPLGNFSIELSVPDGTIDFDVWTYDEEGNLAELTVYTEVDTYCEVSVWAPRDGFTTNGSSVLVQGVVYENADVTVNGVFVQVVIFAFSSQVVLQPGENVIVVEATDAAGNTGQALLHVTFNDPIPPLLAALANATAALAEVESQLAANASAVSALQGQLAAVQADVAAAVANMSNVSGNDPHVAQLQVTLADAMARANGTQANLTRTQADLEQARAEAAAARVSADSAASASSMALIVGLLGAALGAAGILLSLRRGRPPSASTAGAEERRRGAPEDEFRLPLGTQ